MLKLTRRPQQSVVVYRNGESNDPLVIRVVEVLPGEVSLGFNGSTYTVVRSEIFNNGGFESHVTDKETS